MTKSKQTITLKPKESKRITKRLALFAFSTFRGAIDNATKLPGVLLETASDIRDAWQETARPKA
jgi:hypothetical protein